jgi:hypothetical protein
VALLLALVAIGLVVYGGAVAALFGREWRDMLRRRGTDASASTAD